MAPSGNPGGSRDACHPARRESRRARVGGLCPARGRTFAGACAADWQAPSGSILLDFCSAGRDGSTFLGEVRLARPRLPVSQSHRAAGQVRTRRSTAASSAPTTTS